MSATMNLVIPSGARIMGAAESHGVQRELTNFLKRHEPPEGGYVALGGIDIRGVGVHTLRQQIIVLDRPNTMEMTVREYLELSGEEASANTIVDVLRTVGLEPTIAHLEDGLDTRIAPSGWPMTIIETMQLMLASAIIANPKVLILNQLFDTMNDEVLRRSLDRLQDNGETTVIYFSGRNHDVGFSHYLFLGQDEQTLFTDFENLWERCRTEACQISISQPGSDLPAPEPSPARG